MKTLLWLDDIRNPYSADWVTQYSPDYTYDKLTHKIIWVKNYKEFTEWITDHGLPTEIGFDHDLGLEESGMDCAKWLINHCMGINEPLPKWFIQSANPVGAENINGILNNYKKFSEK